MAPRAAAFGKAVVTLFVRPLCGMCAVVKRWLGDLRVAYREIDVSADPGARRILRALTRGDLLVPTLILEDGRVLIEPARDAVLKALGQRPH